MPDLDQRLHQWRQELEATLAFSSEEIDELEDHLRISSEAKLKEGLAPDIAWSQSLVGLGTASALALEFAKEKLLPALGRLLLAWWLPTCLMILFGAIYVYSFTAEPELTSPSETPTQDLASRSPFFWSITTLALLLSVRLLPKKSHKNAVIAGIGNAFCLIPLLHLLVYNAIIEKLIGPGWSHMATSFGWLPITLGLAGLVIINLWWKRTAAKTEQNAYLLTIAGLLVLVFALSPFTGEFIGNLSIRDVYSMPTPSDVTYIGETRSDFLKWKFVDVMVNGVVFIANILPFALALVISGGSFSSNSSPVFGRTKPSVMRIHFLQCPVCLGS